MDIVAATYVATLLLFVSSMVVATLLSISTNALDYTHRRFFGSFLFRCIFLTGCLLGISRLSGNPVLAFDVIFLSIGMLFFEFARAFAAAVRKRM